MPGLPRSSPGWYPDPGQPHPAAARILRYWDGKGWTDRRRPQPVLTTLDISGLTATAVTQERRAIERPVRAGELPAPAPAPAPTAEISASSTKAQTQDAPARPAGPASGDERPGTAPPTATGSNQGPPAPPDLTGGRGGGGNGDEEPGAQARSRRKWWFLAGVAVLSAVAVGLVGVALKPKSPGPRVLTDQHFVQLANQECSRTMKNLRPPDGGPLGSIQTPAQAATQIDVAASGLDSLATRLAAIPAAEADKAYLASWLDGWHGFAGVGHSYADYLRQHGANQNQPPAMLEKGAQLARATDNFAKANGLVDCTFAVVPLMDPSSM